REKGLESFEASGGSPDADDQRRPGRLLALVSLVVARHGRAPCHAASFDRACAPPARDFLEIAPRTLYRPVSNLLTRAARRNPGDAVSTRRFTPKSKWTFVGRYVCLLRGTIPPRCHAGRGSGSCS